MGGYPPFNLLMTLFNPVLQNGRRVSFKRILICFEVSSSMKINLFKIMLVGAGCSKGIIQPIANRLHCRTGRFPFQFLELPIGANTRLKVLWSQADENFEKSSLWKWQYLSLGGRITLITLSDLPIYYFVKKRSFKNQCAK